MSSTFLCGIPQNVHIVAAKYCEIIFKKKICLSFTIRNFQVDETMKWIYAQVDTKLIEFGKDDLALDQGILNS